MGYAKLTGVDEICICLLVFDNYITYLGWGLIICYIPE